MNEFPKLKKKDLADAPPSNNFMGKINMPKMNLPGKKVNPQVKLGLMAILAVVIIGAVVFCWMGQLPPNEAVNKAFEQTINASSYSYYAASNRINGDKIEPLSEVWGEKNNDDVHLIGQIHAVNAMFEVFQVENKFYRQDYVSKEWFVVEGDNIHATEKLIQEVNPLGAFQFTGEIQAEYLGKEKISKTKCKAYEVMAENENMYLASLWQDYYYKVWVDGKGNLKQVEIMAVNKDNPEMKLDMVVQFQINAKPVAIVPPVGE